MERITLEQFRDDVVLCTDIETVIQNIVKQPDSVYEIPRSVVQMLLVLGKCYFASQLKLSSKSLIKGGGGSIPQLFLNFGYCRGRK